MDISAVRIAYSFCCYDVFGFDGLENRLLKKALVFVKRYLDVYFEQSGHFDTLNDQSLNDLFNFIQPAFESVSEEVSLYEVKHTKTNVFYKEYEEGVKLAKLILRRFGYNVNNVEAKKVEMVPFWIDKSKLFELYVLGYVCISILASTQL